MVKIILISYYFPPCQGIAAWRLKSFASAIVKNGYQLHVFTRQWTGKENTWSDYLIESKIPTYSSRIDNYDVTFIQQKHANWYKNSNPVKTLAHWIKGDFQPEQYHYKEFYSEIDDYLSSNNADLIISSSFPLNNHKIAFHISKKYNIPYLLDFRDTWNNETTNPDARISIKRTIEDYFRKKYIRKWINNSADFITISPTFQNFFKENLNPLEKNGNSIFNGYEEEIFKGYRNEIRNSLFTISVIGTIYPNQEIDFMIDGLNLFLENKNPANISINFIGIKVIKEVEERINNSIQKDYLNLTDKIERDKAINIMSESDILYYPGWKGYKGIYSGKIFEYLGMHKTILIAPSDKDVLEELITETNSGKVAHTVKEMASFLNEWFQEWVENGQIEYEGNKKVIQKYSREYQGKMLISLINNSI